MNRTLGLTATVLTLLLTSCPGSYDNPTPVDTGGGGGDGPKWYHDGPGPWYDAPHQDDGWSQPPDTWWPQPDIMPPQSDLFPPSPDMYTGGPFGCTQDSDCFGLKCCPTPWGVKLCAETCQQT